MSQNTGFNWTENRYRSNLDIFLNHYQPQPLDNCYKHQGDSVNKRACSCNHYPDVWLHCMWCLNDSDPPSQPLMDPTFSVQSLYPLLLSLGKQCHSLKYKIVLKITSEIPSISSQNFKNYADKNLLFDKCHTVKILQNS